MSARRGNRGTVDHGAQWITWNNSVVVRNKKVKYCHLFTFIGALSAYVVSIWKPPLLLDRWEKVCFLPLKVIFPTLSFHAIFFWSKGPKSFMIFVEDPVSECKHTTICDINWRPSVIETYHEIEIVHVGHSESGHSGSQYICMFTVFILFWTFRKYKEKATLYIVSVKWM